ncbi:MAG: LysR substrate-binding domain-containing protein [Caulobacter sp.]
MSAARRILADLNDTEQSIADQGAPRGRLRVSASLSHGRLCIVPLLPEFMRLHPHIVVDLNLTDQVVDIAAGQADVGIRFGPLADSGLTARKIGESGRVIVASPEYLARRGTPREPEDLLDHNCLNFNFRRAEPTWPFVRQGERFILPVRGGLEANNGDTLVQAALAGSGVTRVGAFSVAQPVEEGRLVPLLEAFNPGDTEHVHAVFVGGANTPARVRVFIDYLAAAHTL